MSIVVLMFFALLRGMLAGFDSLLVERITKEAVFML